MVEASNFSWHEIQALPFSFILLPNAFLRHFSGVFLHPMGSFAGEIFLPYEKKIALEKKMNIFANECICPNYSNIFEYQIIFPGLFWTILANFLFCVILDPY